MICMYFLVSQTYSREPGCEKKNNAHNADTSVGTGLLVATNGPVEDGLPKSAQKKNKRSIVEK